MLFLPELLPFFIKGKKDHIDWFRFNNGYLVYVITHSDDVSELLPVREVGVYRRVIGGSCLLESLIIESLSNEEINTLYKIQHKRTGQVLVFYLQQYVDFVLYNTINKKIGSTNND